MHRHWDTQLAIMAELRLGVRLASLPRDVLIELCTTTCTAGVESSQRAAEIALAKYCLVPAWAVEEVLLSADILPHVMVSMTFREDAAAAVCKTWRAAWLATSSNRRILHLHRAELNINDALRAIVDHVSTHMAALPGERLCFSSRSSHRVNSSCLSVFNKDLNVLQRRRELEFRVDHMTAGVEGVFVVGFSSGSWILRKLHPETLETVGEYHLNAALHDELGCMVLASGHSLFAVVSNIERHRRDFQNEIIALNPQSLELQHRFGQGIFAIPRVDGGADTDDADSSNTVATMALVREKLYVLACDGTCRIFSLTGELLSQLSESIYSEKLCFVEDRLYTQDLLGSEHGIMVYDLDGTLLQQYEAQEYKSLSEMCPFDGKLLVLTRTPSTLCAYKGL